MIKVALALFIAMIVSVSSEPDQKAVAYIYGEINSYSSSYGAYPAPAPYGGSYGYPSAPSYSSGYPPKPSSYGAYPPKPSSYGAYPPKPSSYGAYPPKPSSYGAYPPKPSSSYSPSYSSGRYKRSTYPQPSYGSYPAPAPAYGGSYNKPSYGTKQTITGTVKFEEDAGTVTYKVNLKVNPPTPGGYGYEEIARSIVVNRLGVGMSFKENSYSSGYGSSSSYATNPYAYKKQKTIEDICSETGETRYTLNGEVEEVYGYISTNGEITSISSIDKLIGRSVVVYKDKDDTASSSGAEPIACGTIAITKEGSG